MTYERELAGLLAYLNSEQRTKELIEVEYTDELQLIIGSKTIVVQFEEISKGMYFPGIGEKIGSEGKVELVRLNSNGNLILKPKSIQEYLDRISKGP